MTKISGNYNTSWLPWLNKDQGSVPADNNVSYALKPGETAGSTHGPSMLGTSEVKFPWEISSTEGSSGTPGTHAQAYTSAPFGGITKLVADAPVNPNGSRNIEQVGPKLPGRDVINKTELSWIA